MVKKLGAGQFGEVWMGKKQKKVQLRNVAFVTNLYSSFSASMVG